MEHGELQGDRVPLPGPQRPVHRGDDRGRRAGRPRRRAADRRRVRADAQVGRPVGAGRCWSRSRTRCPPATRARRSAPRTSRRSPTGIPPLRGGAGLREGPEDRPVRHRQAAGAGRARGVQDARSRRVDQHHPPLPRRARGQALVRGGGVDAALADVSRAGRVRQSRVPGQGCGPPTTSSTSLVRAHPAIIRPGPVASSAGGQARHARAGRRSPSGCWPGRGCSCAGRAARG